MYKRLTYDELIVHVLWSYYRICRSAFLPRRSNWKENIRRLHQVAGNDDGVFEHPAERIMYLLTIITLGCDCSDKEMLHFRNVLEKEISENDMSKVLADLPEEERKRLLFDLNSFNFSLA